MILRRTFVAMAAWPAVGHSTSPEPSSRPLVYRFSPVNQYGIELTAAYWNPIIAYVAKRTGLKLQLKIGRTSADTTAYVLANEVEFVFSNHLFSPERDRLGWRVLARRQSEPIHSQVAVLESSEHHTLQDLQGRLVAFPGPEATVAYKFAYAHLRQRGVEVQVVFGGNMDGAFGQLLSGKAAAVGTHSQLSEGWSKRTGQSLRVLWSSPPLPDLALMASRGVPAADADLVRRTFAGMLADPEGRAVLTSASALVRLPGPTGFVVSDGSEFAPYREFYRTAPADLK
jgi:phosphonate transport system substrate-binding protein